jgi:hypothetical protein
MRGVKVLPVIFIREIGCEDGPKKATRPQDEARNPAGGICNPIR